MVILREQAADYKVQGLRDTAAETDTFRRGESQHLCQIRPESEEPVKDRELTLPAGPVYVGAVPLQKCLDDIPYSGSLGEAGGGVIQVNASHGAIIAQIPLYF